MADDRQLLEDAARAAGYIVVGDVHPADGLNVQFEPGGLVWVWMPLTDDGDALRLAVKLKMRVTVDDDWSGAGWDAHQSAPTMDGRGPWGWKEWHYPMSGPDAGRTRDPMAATRRAIVRAAAQLGAAMRGGESNG